MATTARDLPPAAVRRVISRFAPGTGTDRYARFITEILEYRLGAVQRRLLDALATNRRTVAVGANGVGKSFGLGGLGSIASLYCNLDCTVNITSGSYGQLDDTIWKPIKNIHRNSMLPGRTLDNKRELKSGIDEEWYLKCLSPRHPADLEGRHNRRMVYIIEEADKTGITDEHIDSAESTLTDEKDRMLVIANPPDDETNIVSKLMDSDQWTTINFSSFESHNVQVDIGEHPGPKIPGLIELSEIKENWEAWNRTDWPGYETAFTAHEDSNTLDRRWYRRRAGVRPPVGAENWRPIEVMDVKNAYGRQNPPVRHETPSSVAIDVARSGDKTVMVGVHGPELRVHYAEPGANHAVQKQALRDMIDTWPSPMITVDAVGEGSGLADDMDLWFPNVVRYSNGSEARQRDEYYKCWSESLDVLGDFLADGGVIHNDDLREELLIAASVVELSEKAMKSRGGPDGTNVVQASSKDDIKDELNHSPDYLDAAAMAVWREQTQDTTLDQLTW